MFLWLDSASESKEITIRIINKNGKILAEEIWTSEQNESEIFLNKLEKLMHSSKIGRSKLGAVFVNPGPGPYTSLRIGIAIANAIGFSLRVPVIALTGGEIKNAIKIFYKRGFEGPVKPIYKYKPKITNSTRPKI